MGLLRCKACGWMGEDHQAATSDGDNFLHCPIHSQCGPLVNVTSSDEWPDTPLLNFNDAALGAFVRERKLLEAIEFALEFYRGVNQGPGSDVPSQYHTLKRLANELRLLLESQAKEAGKR